MDTPLLTVGGPYEVDVEREDFIKRPNGRVHDAHLCVVVAQAQGVKELMGGDVMGMYLVPQQRAELVTLLSNQAECYLRLNKYEDAIVQASKALQLDRRHSKSLLRRAKATIRRSEQHGSTLLNSMAAASAAEDLQAIIEMKGEVVPEAESLIAEIEEQTNKISARSEQ